MIDMKDAETEDDGFFRSLKREKCYTINDAIANVDDNESSQSKPIIKVLYHADIPELKFIGGEKSDWIDLYSGEDVVLYKEDYKLISLGISVELPKGYEAHVVPRSSTFKNYGIIQANSVGVIDESYKGENDIWYFPCIAMRNTIIHKGDRIAQFRIIKKMQDISLEKVNQLNNPDRGGIGSTGKR